MPDFIAGIHNYCDRWCEKCTFTARCRVGEAESATSDEERDINNKAFWRNLTNIFAEAKTMILEKVEELGIDLNAVNHEEFAENRAREKTFIHNKELIKLTEKYWKDARKTLDAKDDWLIFSPLDEYAQSEILAIICWYQFFISAKIQRGFKGILDFDGNLDEAELNDSQSDSNGSIKVALIAINRLIMAWTNLLSDENSKTIAPHISLLQTIKQTTEKKFPNVQDFVRPGFDEIETVM